MMLMKARMSVILIILGLLALPAFAAGVQIIGEEFAEVDISSGRFVFEGPVTVTDGSTTIKGTHLVYLSKEEILQFVGDVTIEHDGTSLAGKDLMYDASKSEGALSQALVTALPSGALAPVYISGDQVNACPSLTVIDGAALTTCDPGVSGYFLASKRIEIRPGDRLVLYNVRFIESGLTLFYWPRVTFSLKPTDPDAEAISLPRIGYSANEGWFVKSSFGYRGPANQRGRLLVDYMQLLGWGFGIDHVLRADEKGSEGFLIYAQPNMQTGHTDMKLTLRGERDFAGNLRVRGSSTVSTEYEQGEELWYHHQLNLSQQRESGSSQLSYSDKRVSGAKTGHETYATLSHSQNSPDGWRLRVSANVDTRDMPELVRRNLVGYRADVGRETSNWGFDLTAEDQFNPELAKDDPSDITWNRAKRLPELRLRMKRLNLKGYEIPLTGDMAWGRLTEDRLAYPNPIRTNTDRFHLALKTKLPQYDFGRWGRWRWDGSLTRRTYGTGEKQWVVGAQSVHQLALAQGLGLDVNYRYEEAFGDLSPFRFDRVVAEEKLRLTLRYNTEPVGMTLAGGYDLLYKEPLDVVGSLRWQLAPSFRVQTQASYSVVDEDWLYVIGAAQYIPSEKFSVQLGSRYNMQTRYPDRVDAALRWHIEGWSVAYTGIYDGLEGEFPVGDFVITRDLDCRAIDFRYNQNRREFWVEYRIPAFPAASVKFGATEQHLMFDAKGWEEVLAIE
jgi:hypothetical protein